MKATTALYGGRGAKISMCVALLGFQHRHIPAVNVAQPEPDLREPGISAEADTPCCLVGS